MSIVDLIMPKLGESITEATILKWHKNPGDIVKEDETILEIATDKVDSEVPSTASGTLSEILFNVNDVVAVGTVIARIETTVGAAVVPAPAASPAPVPVVEAPQTPVVADIPYVPANASVTPSSNGNRFYSPLVLNIAGSEGISMVELETIPGTGNEGRVTKKDILQYVSNKKAGVVTARPEPVAPAPPPVTAVPRHEIAKMEVPAVRESAPDTYAGANVEIIEMDRMRKLIAKHMVDSKHISPHVTSFAEADVTNMVLWRDKVKKEFEKRENTRITFTPLFIDCLTRVIKRFPITNSSVDGDSIIIKKDINIGMATALPAGNLIVHTIRNADFLNLVGLL